MTSKNENLLYNFIFPDGQICRETELYFRLNGDALYSYEQQTIFLHTGAEVNTLTYFNLLSVDKWSKNTNVNEVAAFLIIKGKGEVEALLLTLTGINILAKWNFDFTDASRFLSPNLSLPSKGLLGVNVKAKTPCEITDGGLLTPAPPLREVAAALCFVTYKREDLIKKTVARLSNAFQKDDLNYPDVIVVDNGQSLSVEDLPGALLIPNKNLGGTGGFMRALSHCEESGKYTHCLFMDDDAECEPGSIYRALSFLSHAIDEDMAIAGAMLYADPQWKLWENGAYFDYGYHPYGRDLDMREPKALLEINTQPDRKIYGAWWFFIFPIKTVKNYAFPFFVHGDDVDFSYNNEFKIVTLNGVCAWHEDFKDRSSSHSVYFRVRSQIVFYLKGNTDFTKIKAMLTKTFQNNNDAYFYGSAACVNLAIKHVLSGPYFWEDNLDMSKIYPLIKKLGETENLAFEPEHGATPGDPIKLKYFHKQIRAWSLNGHLIPSFLLSQKKEYIEKACSPSPMRTFLRAASTIKDKYGNRSVLKRNTVKYFHNLFEFLFLLFLLKHKWNSLVKEYDKQALRSRQSWKKRFGMDRV